MIISTYGTAAVALERSLSVSIVPHSFPPLASGLTVLSSPYNSAMSTISFGHSFQHEASRNQEQFHLVDTQSAQDTTQNLASDVLKTRRSSGSYRRGFGWPGESHGNCQHPQCMNNDNNDYKTTLTFTLGGPASGLPDPTAPTQSTEPSQPPATDSPEQTVSSPTQETSTSTSPSTVAATSSAQETGTVSPDATPNLPQSSEAPESPEESIIVTTIAQPGSPPMTSTILTSTVSKAFPASTLTSTSTIDLNSSASAQTRPMNGVGAGPLAGIIIGAILIFILIVGGYDIIYRRLF